MSRWKEESETDRLWLPCPCGFSSYSPQMMAREICKDMASPLWHRAQTRIWCVGCGAAIRMANADEAIAAWNRRSTLPVGAETADLSLDPTEWHYAVAAITKEAERMYGCSPLTLEINRRLSGSDNPLADAYASRTLFAAPPRSDKANDEAEAWCRLAGQAVDALDALSGWEVESDDEDAAGQMAEYAEKAVAAVRKAYPPVSTSPAVREE